MICIEDIWYDETFIGTQPQSFIDYCSRGSKVLKNVGGFMPMLLNPMIKENGEHLKAYLAKEQWVNSIFKEYESYMIPSYQDESDHVITRVFFQEIPWRNMQWFCYRLNLSS